MTMTLLQEAKRHTPEIPLREQLADMWRLWFTNRIYPNEYYEMKMYGKKPAYQREYIGFIESKKIWNSYNAHLDEAVDPFLNKVRMETFLANLYPKLPLPETVYTSYAKDFSFTHMLERIQRHLPVFVKPISGYGGQGTMKLVKWSELLNCFYTDEKKMVTRDKLIDKFITGSYIFQKIIVPHRELESISESSALGTVRVVTKMFLGEPEIIASFYKMPGPDSITDNYNGKDNGTIIIELETGAYLRPTYKHDKKYAKLMGMRFPYANEVRDVAKRVALETHLKTNGKINLLGIDVGVTDKGPVIVEINRCPGFRSVQTIYDRGFRFALDSMVSGAGQW